MSLPLPHDRPMGFAVRKYPDPAAYEAHLRQLEADSGGLLALHTESRCWSGEHPLWHLTVGDTQKPAFFVTSVLHAKNEWQGAHVAMNLVRQLVDKNSAQHDFRAAFLDQYCLVAIPMVNAWGYFAAPDGMHHNGHRMRVPDIEKADWHDMQAYSWFSGVNLNRNFDWNWEAFVDLPFSVRSYWNGTDYGFANYFMMPFRKDEHGHKFYEPTGTAPGRLLEPDPDIYDGKGTAPFSEPETRLIRDLFGRFGVAGFIDIHTMNPWQKNNTDYVSRKTDRAAMLTLVDDGLTRVNARHTETGAALPKTHHMVMEEYGDNAPYSINWAQNRMGVPAYGWETGTGLPEPLWTDAYMEILYRALCWMDQERHRREGSGDQKTESGSQDGSV